MNNTIIEKVSLVLVIVVFGGMVWAIVTMRTEPTEQTPIIVPTVQPTPTPVKTGSEEEGEYNLNTPTPSNSKTTITPTVTISLTATPTASSTVAPPISVTPTPIGAIESEYVLRGFEYAYDPSVIQVKAGTKMKVQFTNTGNMAHDFVISELNVASGLVQPGESKTIEFVIPVNGQSEYKYYCSIGNHRQLGMEGRIVVQQ